MRLISSAAFALSLVFSSHAAFAQSDPVSWRVLDRYRLFSSSEAASSLRADAGVSSAQDLLLDQLLADDAKPSATAHYDTLVRFLNERQPIGGRSDYPYLRTRWRNREGVPRERRYDSDYLYPTFYTIAARLPGGTGDSCAWSLGGQRVVTNCNQGVRFSVRSAADARGSEPVTLQVVVNAPDRADVTLVQRIVVRDRLFVSFGESFASGEGNPDVPQDMSGLDGHPTKWIADFRNRWWLREGHLNNVRLAQWMDPWCHRSLNSQHAVASMVYAARHPHEAVTFASFACSGASVENGIVYPQTSPPGTPEFGKLVDPPTQIEALQELRCRNQVVRNRGEAAALLATFDASRDEMFSRNRLQRDGSGVSAMCADGRPVRGVDAILLSMGGNDVGFSGAIVDTILPQRVADNLGRFALGVARKALNAVTLQDAGARLALLSARYDAQRVLFRRAFGENVPVVQSLYPNPLRFRARYCGGNPDNGLLEALAGVYPDKYVDEEKRWRFGVVPARAREAEERLIVPLNGQIRSLAARDRAWRLNGDFEAAFYDHGWCAAPAASDAFAFPNWDAEARAWKPFTPSAWRAYASRDRWFRTPNDAALTQIASLRNVDRTIITLRDGPMRATAGAFHPTFEGHAVMGRHGADALQRALDDQPSQ